MSGLPLSALVLTYNEEANIEACLHSLHGWIDEIIVVDSGSTDRTLDIVRQYTEKIYAHPFENYATQRNWAQDNLPISHAWIFHLDADEQVTPELRASLEDFFVRGPADEVDGLLVARRALFMGRWIRHGGHYPVYHLRLYRRTRGRCEDRHYDQHFVTTGRTRHIRGDLIDLITPDLNRWTQRHMRWADLEAQAYLAGGHAEGVRVAERLRGNPIEQRRWARTSIYDRLPLFARVFMYFIYRYVLRLGFLDGVEGLIFHVLQGFWFRFYIDARIWEMRRNGRAKS